MEKMLSSISLVN